MKHLLLPLLLAPSALAADPAKIEKVTARQTGGQWSFSVTLSHGDTGWDDYADGWRILDANGTVLGTRVLAHPHVNEQPFTRSLSGVSIPEGLTEVTIEASENVGGWGGETVQFVLPQ